ncbi:hypothetical protein [Aquipuribacter hungaricus]|uniref:Adhesin domain-containing protein n=1 Tax=Aquipuribacter hungaricus TaxID=545624 RepID=A0ABV7WKV6_9MICO
MTVQPPAPYGQAPYGQAPYGQTPYGQSRYGQTPYGQVPYGQVPSGGGTDGPPPQQPGGATAVAPPPGSRPPVPWWAGVLAVLGVLTVLGVVGAAVAGLVVEASTRDVTERVDETGVRTLRIEGVTGGVNLETEDAPAGTVRGSTEVTTAFQEAELTTVRDGDELVLRATCPDTGWPRRCDVGYDLVVDPDLDVVVDIVTGGLRGSGLAGDVDVSVTAGGVLLEDTRSQDVGVDVTTGGIALSFVEPPREVRLTATTGGIDVGVPDDGTAYDMRTSVTVGEVGVSLPDDDDAERSISASTTVGGISIHTGDSQYGPPDSRPDRTARP